MGLALELADIDLWNIDLLDTHLDLLDTDIPSKKFVCLHNVFKTSSRHVLKTSWRRLQRNNFSSSKTSSRRLARGLENIFKTSSRRLCETSSRSLGRRKIITLKTCWRRLQDQQMFAGCVFSHCTLHVLLSLLLIALKAIFVNKTVQFCFY